MGRATPAPSPAVRDLPPQVVTRVRGLIDIPTSANDARYGKRAAAPVRCRKARVQVGDLKYMPDLLPTLEYQV